jgi:hypothetical protein
MKTDCSYCRMRALRLGCPAVPRPGPISHLHRETIKMKTRTVFLALAFCLFTAALSFASDPSIGTWKLNEAKSKIPAGAGKNVTVVYTADGDNLKAVLDGVDGSGKPTHSEWVGKFDGKDYPVTGAPNVDARSIKMVDEHHYKIANLKDGKVTQTGTLVIAPDGKSRVLKTSGTDAAGKKTSATFVYDKE